MSEETHEQPSAEITNPNEYQEAALQTLAPDDLIDFKRVHYGTIRRALREFINAGTTLDHVKKSVVYGRPFPGQLSLGEQPCPAPDLSKIDVQVVHALLGIITEATELAQALEAVLFRGADCDAVNLLEESGDIDWYQALLDHVLGATQEERWTTNINKLLRKRYAKSGGFTPEEANTRDTEGEREILEEGHGQEKPSSPEDVSDEQSGESSGDGEPAPVESGEPIESSTEEESAKADAELAEELGSDPEITAPDTESESEEEIVIDPETEFNEDPAPESESEDDEDDKPQD